MASAGVEGSMNEKQAGPRVAVLGFSLEAHRWAEPCGLADFKRYGWFEGEEITVEARSAKPAIKQEIPGFYAGMDEAYGKNEWQPVPIMLINTAPAGPVEAAFYKAHIDDVQARLRSSLPLDGVYICQHGGACAEHEDDSDGDYFAMVRAVVGPDVPVISTLDLHSNISERQVADTDLMIGFIEYPHTDKYDRGLEAARAMELMISHGVRCAKAHIRLPIVIPLVAQGPTEFGPYGDLIRLGQTKVDEDVLNVTILSGFDFSDTWKNGLTILVYARGCEGVKQKKVDRICRELAIAGWNDRHRYVERLEQINTLQEATAMAKRVGDDSSLQPLLFADIADNPGGGARSNTTFVLKAFLDAGVTGAVFGHFYDIAAVKRCHEAGVGATLRLMLNAEEDHPRSEKLEVNGKVLAISEDGVFYPSLGTAAGKKDTLGPCASFEIADSGITIILKSLRVQCRSFDDFEFMGIDPYAARSIVVKSSIHYRAGFRHVFEPERIIEIETPGLTSSNHATLPWARIPRPFYPLDRHTTWTAPDCIEE